MDPESLSVPAQIAADLSLGDQIAFIVDSWGRSLRRLYWPWVVISVGMAAVIWSIGRQQRPAGQSFLAFLFPKSVWLHPSSIVDYWFIVVDKLGINLVIALFVIGTGSAVLADVPMVRGWADAGQDWMYLASYTICAWLVYDFARFFAHYLQHKWPILWEFHKVHHSARVLNVFTNYRMHPIDKLSKFIIVGLCMGALVWVFEALAPGHLTVVEILGVNAGRVLFDVMGSNLRHTHIWLSFGPRLSYIFMSPAQHQIHHSKEEKHFDKNMGLQFSLWDWMFGTLYVPQVREDLQLGLPDGEDEEFSSVWRLYFLPFSKATTLVKSSRLPWLFGIGAR